MSESPYNTYNNQLPQQHYHVLSQHPQQQLNQFQQPMQIQQIPSHCQQVYVHLVCVEGKPFILYEDEPTRLYPAFISHDSYYGQPRTL